MLKIEVEVRGKKLQAAIGTNGIFECRIDAQTVVRADTLAGLKERLLTATRRQTLKTNIPLYRYVGRKGLQAGVATGIHATNGNVLIKWEGEKGVDQSSYTRYMRIEPSELAEAIAMYAALAQAECAADKFRDSHSFDPKEAVTKAVNGAGDSDEIID